LAQHPDYSRIVNRVDRAAFFAEGPFVVASQVSLSESDAAHVSVLRLGVGERVGLRDGAGNNASGTLVRLGRKNALVELDEVTEVQPVPAIHLLVPVADRDRMLWLAEKVAELNIASWRPVLWQRSRSVSPRGDGPTFRSKVRSRMISALLQSRSSWLPEIFPEATPERAIAASPAAGGARFFLNAGATSLAGVAMQAPVVIAVGPEGGFEADEIAALEAAGFAGVSIGQAILRFETAAVAGVAIARAMLDTETNNEGNSDG
jgi:16S rRNA (uracil1498-N3)-methyltransferase